MQASVTRSQHKQKLKNSNEVVLSVMNFLSSYAIGNRLQTDAINSVKWKIENV
jgi:hypothetical protein